MYSRVNTLHSANDNNNNGYNHLPSNSALTNQAKCIIRYYQNPPYYSTFEHLPFHSNEHKSDYEQVYTMNLNVNA